MFLYYVNSSVNIQLYKGIHQRKVIQTNYSLVTFVSTVIVNYFPVIEISSTSKIRVAPPGIGPVPRSPYAKSLGI